MALLAVLLVVVLLAAFWEYTQDDVFITYAYSRNIALGNGFVFNSGEHVQGTTTPLYTLIMAIVYRITPDLLHAGNALSALFLLLGGVLALTIPRQGTTRIGQIGLILILLTSPLIYVSFGMETLFYFALLMGSFWLWARGRRSFAILAAAALTWTRADGVVLGLTLCLVALWEVRQTRPIWRAVPWRLGLLYLLAILPWFAFAWLYFGSPLPNTFSAKQELLKGIKFWTDGWNWWQSFYGNNPLSLLAIPLVGIGLWQALRQSTLRPLVLWVILYLAGYTALNVTAFWYYSAWVATLMLLAIIGGEYIVRRLLTIRRLSMGPHSRVVLQVVCVAILSISGALGFGRSLDFHTPPERVATYRLLGQWLQQHTPPDSTVVVADLGLVGYYAQRRMVDSFGLIVPTMAASHDLQGAVQKFQPDYVVATQYFFFGPLVQADWFKALYEPLVKFSTLHDSFSPMTVYQRLPNTSNGIPADKLPVITAVSTDWPPLARLISAALPDGSLTWSGGTLTVRLDWQALSAPSPDDVIFTHVLDATGKLVAQQDGPLNGQANMTWQPNDKITDLRKITLPPTLPEGDYTLEIGWYDWQSGKRVSLQNNGIAAGDHLPLPFTIHNQWPGGSGMP